MTDGINPPNPSDNIMNDDSNTVKKPKLFLYSLLFPISWILITELEDRLIPGKFIGMSRVIIFIIVLFMALSLICYRIAINYKRTLSETEKIKMILYLSVYELSFIALGSYKLFFLPKLYPSISLATKIASIIFGIFCSIGLIVGVVQRYSNAIIVHFLRRQGYY